jgi:hypothetical protein
MRGGALTNDDGLGRNTASDEDCVEDSGSQVMPTAIAAVYTCIMQTMHMHVQINL